MIEQKLEKVMVDRLEELLDGYSIQVCGTLQPSMFDVKGEEEDGKKGVLVVKFSPREYTSPMTPECQLNCALSFTLRADVDYNGKNYLEVCDLIMNELEKFQKCLYDVHQEYSLPNEFNATGFKLGSGQTSVD